jgi:hypothetical protein
MQTHAGPLYVRLVVSEHMPEEIVGKGLSDISKPEDRAHHEQHDKAAVGVHSHIYAETLIHTRFVHSQVRSSTERFVYFKKNSA